jgi:DNA-binding MarR family transcriptional regulator
MILADLTRQGQRLYAVLAELVRRYQFRDRDQICCHGLTVSQCYALEALASRDFMTMGELANHLGLRLSSATRVVDYLAACGLVRRSEDPSDRRICRLRIVGKGRALVARINGGLVQEYEEVLRNVVPESREAVIQAIADLLKAFERRKCCTTAEADCA